MPPGDSVELDCGRPQSRTDLSVGGLVYCSSGGTGRVQQLGVPPSDFPPFPRDRFGPFDPDDDGFGTPQTLAKAPDRMLLRHGATSAAIGTGDVLIYRVTAGGVERQVAGAVEYVFATIPALVSYDDGEGNAATLSYPITPGPATKELPVAAARTGT